MGRRNPQAWMITAAATLSSAMAMTAMAQSTTSGAPNFRAYGGSWNSRYDDLSKNEIQGRQGRQSDVKLDGFRSVIAGQYAGYELEIDFRRFFPVESDHWHRRSETLVNLGYYWSQLPWASVYFGYGQTFQKGSRTASDAPVAFLDRNRYFVLGSRFQVVPWAYQNTHGIQLMGHYQYLTSMEKDKNFGTEGFYGFGYAFKDGGAGLTMSLVYGRMRQFFNGSVPDEDDQDYYRHVRYTYVGDSIALYFEY